MDRAVAYMDAHLREPFDLQRIAEEANVSTFYLIRVFKRLTGLTPLSYFRRARMKEIDRVLEEHPEISLTELAMEFGFSSPSAFTREYNALTGEMPKSCRSFFQEQQSTCIADEVNI